MENNQSLMKVNRNFFNSWNLNRNFAGIMLQASRAHKNVIRSEKFTFNHGLLSGTQNLLQCYYEATKDRAMLFFRYQHTHPEDHKEGKIRLNSVDVFCTLEDGEIIRINPKSYFSPKGKQLSKFKSQLVAKDGPDPSDIGECKWHFWVLYARTPFTKEDNRGSQFYLNEFSRFTFQISMTQIRNTVQINNTGMNPIQYPLKIVTPINKTENQSEKKPEFPLVYKNDSSAIKFPAVYAPTMKAEFSVRADNASLCKKVKSPVDNVQVFKKEKWNYYQKKNEADQKFGKREFPEVFELTKFRRAMKKRNIRLSNWDGIEILNPSKKKIARWAMPEVYKTKIPFIGNWKCDLMDMGSTARRNRHVEWINTIEGLQKVRTACTNSGVFAFDMEMSDRDSNIGHTTLIQISTTTADFLIDPLVLFAQIKYTLGPVFQNPNILKLAFSIGNEIRFLARDFDIYVVGGIDVQRIYRNIFENEGLKFSLNDIVARMFNEALEKDICQVADFRLRPLHIELQMYALSDAAVLIPLYNKLMEHWRTISPANKISQTLRLIHSTECLRPISIPFKDPKQRINLNKVDGIRRVIEMILNEISLKYDVKLETLFPTQMIELLMREGKKKKLVNQIINEHHKFLFQVLGDRFVHLREIFLSVPRK